MARSFNIERRGVFYGVIATGGLILYFLIMVALGLAEIMELRFFNFIILFAVLAYALNQYKSQKGENWHYYQGLFLGLIISGVTAALFTIFMAFYLFGGLDEVLANKILKESSLIDYMSPIVMTAGLFAETLSGGFILTFILLQIMKPKIEKDT